MSPFLIGFSFFNCSVVQALTLLSKCSSFRFVFFFCLCFRFIQGFGILVWRSKEFDRAWRVGGVASGAGGCKLRSTSRGGEGGGESVYMYTVSMISQSQENSLSVSTFFSVLGLYAKANWRYRIGQPQIHTILVCLPSNAVHDADDANHTTRKWLDNIDIGQMTRRDTNKK